MAMNHKLEAQGWEVVTVDDLLGLSPSESQMVELHLRLARALRQQRRERDLSQALLAERMRSSQSRVAKMEAADTGVSVDLYVRALLAAGCTLHEIGQIVGGEGQYGGAKREATPESRSGAVRFRNRNRLGATIRITRRKLPGSSATQRPTKPNR